MKRFVIATAVFILGFAAGAFVVYGLSLRASGAYLTGAQLVFINAQDEQASKAWRAGNFHRALGHAFCAFEAQQGVGATRAFARNALPWDLLQLAFLRTMIIDPNQMMTGDKPRPYSEMVPRAKLGVAWERLGQKDAADREFGAIGELTGKADVAAWRRLGLDTIDMWSRVRDEQGSNAQQPPTSPQTPR